MPEDPLPSLGLFREEAVEHYLREVEGKGILKVSPPWTWTLFWTLGVLVALTVVFSAVGKVEVNDRGRGVLRAVGGVRPLVAASGGVVVEQPARPGDLVKQGQPLLRLESADLQGSILESERQLDLLKGDYRSVAAEQDALFARQSGDHERRMSSLQADLKSYERQVEVEQHTLAAQQALQAKGYIPRLDVEKQEAVVSAAERQLRAGHLAVEQEQQQWVATLAQRQQQIFTRKSDLSSAETKREALDLNQKQNLIGAPVDGYVDGLLVRPGDRVQPGQVVGKLVPADSQLHVVSFLPEKDLPYVHPGDKVRVELTGYPYAEFGTLEGTVRRVGKDLASGSEWQEAMGDSERSEGSSYRVEVDLNGERPTSQAQLHLRPGMLLSVRFTLRRDRLITMAFEPLKRWLR